jgi:hypothetical protein
VQNALAEVWDHHADTVPRTKRNLVPGYSELSTRTGVRSRWNQRCAVESTRNISVRRIDSCIKSVLRFGQNLEPKARPVSGLRFIVAYSQHQGAPPCIESYLGQVLRKGTTEECELLPVCPSFESDPSLVLKWSRLARPADHLLPTRHGELYNLRERLSRSAIP